MLITKTQSIRFIRFLFCVYNKITKGSQKKKPYTIILQIIIWYLGGGYLLSLDCIGVLQVVHLSYLASYFENHF